VRRHVVAASLACALAGISTGCDSGGSADAAVELVEFTVSAPQRLSADTDRLDIANVGEFAHTLVITDANGEVAAASGLIPPGETTYLDLDLDAGEYTFTCRMIAQDGEGNIIDHFEAGMHAGVVVEG